MAGKKGRSGRPTKLTDAMGRRIESSLRAGNHLDTAAALCGVDRNTLQRWLRAGYESVTADSLFSRWVERWVIAQAKAEDRHVRALDKLARKDWRAIVAYLERRFPKRWRQRQEMKLTGDPSAPVEHRHQGGLTINVVPSNVVGKDGRAVDDGDDPTDGA